MRSIYTIIDEINREILDQSITDYNDAENNEFISSALSEADDLIKEYVTKEALENVSATIESMMAFHNRIFIGYDEYAQFCASFLSASMNISGPDARAISTMGKTIETMRDVFQVQRTAMETIREMVIGKIKDLSGKVHN